MYFCLSCENRFKTPGIVKEWIGEKEHGGYQEFPICPYCKDDDIEKLKECQMCHEEYIFTEKDRCSECEDSVNLWLSNAIIQIQKDTGADRDDILQAISDWIENL